MGSSVAGRKLSDHRTSPAAGCVLPPGPPGTGAGRRGRAMGARVPRVATQGSQAPPEPPTQKSCTGREDAIPYQGGTVAEGLRRKWPPLGGVVKALPHVWRGTLQSTSMDPGHDRRAGAAW